MKFGKKLTGLVLMGVTAVQTFAATTPSLDTSKVVFNTADVFKVGALILGALATVWAVKESIKFVRRA